MLITEARQFKSIAAVFVHATVYSQSGSDFVSISGIHNKTLNYYSEVTKYSLTKLKNQNIHKMYSSPIKTNKTGRLVTIKDFRMF